MELKSNLEASQIDGLNASFIAIFNRINRDIPDKGFK
jgi:hypothetical protein